MVSNDLNCYNIYDFVTFLLPLPTPHDRVFFIFSWKNADYFLY